EMIYRGSIEFFFAEHPVEHRSREVVEKNLPDDASRAAMKFLLRNVVADDGADDPDERGESRLHTVLGDLVEHGSRLGHLARHQLAVPCGLAAFEDSHEERADERVQL